MPFVAQPREKCAGCGKTVYATEKITIDVGAEGKPFHKQCVRCKECNKILTLQNLASMEGTFYCKPHFSQLFKTKGNYDEGFGREKKAGSYAARPSTFVPGDRDDEPSSAPAKNQSSEETQAKFRAFRTEGDSRKCRICAKTVYAAEEVKAEERNEVFLYHKGCFRCQHEDEGKDEGEQVCNRALDLRSYGSSEGHIYCNTHLKLHSQSKQQQWASGSSTPTSFVPAEVSGEPAAKAENKTSEETQAKFRAFRTEGDSRKCRICAKTVYAAEEVKAEERNEVFLYHKGCFRCQHEDEGKDEGEQVCNRALDLRSYGSSEGHIYCNTHLKLHSASANRQWGSGGGARPTSFVPAEQGGGEAAPQKKETPAHIASKFKSFGATEKCKKCGKSVYATEKITVEELDTKHIYHKTCLRCADCDTKLSLGTYGSLQGIVYCKVHLTERTRFAKQATDDAYFVSPLAAGGEDAPASTGARIDADQPDAVPEHSDDDEPAQQKRSRSPSPARSDDSGSEDDKPEAAKSDSEDAKSDGEDEGAKSDDDAEAKAASGDDEDKPAEKDEPTPAGGDDEDDEEAEFRARKEAREKERAERKAALEAEEAEREKQRAARAAEREARRAEDAAAGGDGGDVDDEIAALEKRRAERAKRRAEMEAEAEAEAEAAKAKREERRKRLEELKAEA
jgi:cysteine and glycine-rich protein